MDSGTRGEKEMATFALIDVGQREGKEREESGMSPR